MARWKKIECCTLATVLLQAIINDTKLRKHLKAELNPWLGLSLNTWSENISKNGLPEQRKLLRLIAHNSDFIPNTEHKRFSRWERGPLIFWEKKRLLKDFRI